MTRNNDVAIIIPIYKGTLSVFENIALEQCHKTLGRFPKIIVKPNSLVLPMSIDKFGFTAIVSFEDSYFAGIQGYNALMLSAEFYRAFLSYKFILIHQLDAFVFKDDLSYWVSQPYDYIGAPWLRRKDYPHYLKAVSAKFLINLYTRFNIKKRGVPHKRQFDDKVGNGGFSLRRVSKFHDLCTSMKLQIAVYLSRDEHEFHEDVFWSIEVNRNKNVLKIPDCSTGLKFAMELWPERAMRLTNGKLPFGCHAWDKNLDFWRPIFKDKGYTI